MELDGLSLTVMPPPAVTLNFHLLTPICNDHIYEPKYICDQNWVKYPSWIFEIWSSQCFRDSRTHSHGQTRKKYASDSSDGC